MPRKLLALALAVVGLHIVEVLTLGTTTGGSILANSLQIFSSGLAAAMCFGASRRGRGLTRPFWLLTGCGMALWAVSNAGWMYYEDWRHSGVPVFSFVRILFDVQGVFFAIALFLDQERDSPNFYAETLLDSLQIAIVFFSIFFGLYYVHVLRGAPLATSEPVRTWIFDGINFGLAGLAGIRMASARTRRLRTLYGGLALYLLIYAAFSGVADYGQAIHNVPTGTWYDLGWTLPFLVGALWAAQWREPEEPVSAALPRKTLTRLAVKNLTLALAPLSVLVLMAQLGPQWRLISFALLAVSIICYAARLGLSEYRQSQISDMAGRHALAMKSAINGMAILDATGKYTYVNPAYARMMGYATPDALRGQPWRETSNPEDVAPVEKEIREGIKQYGKWFGPITVHHRDGTVVPMEMAITSLPDGGTICVSRDITERRKAEQARTETEVKYRMLVEQVAAVTYIAELGVHGEWLYVSPQVEAILGYTQEEWISGSEQWVRFVPTEDHPVIQAAEAACLKGQRFQAEYRINRKDGQVIWVSDTAVVVAGSGSHPLMEGIIVDITERKQLENQLQQARRMEAVGRLAGGVAHDFNNLLTIIKGYVELALNRCQDRPELRADIQHIEQASDRAVTLVRQLLAFSRKQVLKPKVLDLNAIVLNLEKLLQRLLSEDIEMKTIAGENVGAIKADPSQIEQVIMNLVVNARDAMPKGGRVVIETGNAELDANYARDHVTVRSGPYVMLAVADSGVGMSADTVAHIFEPFYTTKESGRGTGLGLSTVYGIVKQSGGYIWVYSEPGKGSTFKIYLPRVEGAAEAPSKIELAELSTRKGTETILLVEDEPAVRELARIVLAEHGYSILEAGNPQDAQVLAGNHAGGIHLLLTDVVMPGMSGRELAMQITSRHPNVRVLYMSGYTNNFIAENGMLEAGLSFLQKPFTPQILVQKVRETLDRPVPAR